MAGKAWEYLPEKVPDYNGTLDVEPQRVLTEMGGFRQEQVEYDDENIQTITFSTTPKIFFRVQWDSITEAEADAIMDMYLDANKAMGMAKSFKFYHDIDELYYIVHFASQISRDTFGHPWRAIPSIMLRVVGYIAET
jgi:hypothetical protein